MAEQLTPTAMEQGFDDGLKRAVGNTVDRVLGSGLDVLKSITGKAKINFINIFKTYLENANARYNQVKTLATGIAPRTIIDEKNEKNNIYVKVGVRYRNEEISTAMVEPLLRISQNILISGTGGAGKTMLMRYLFLNTASSGTYIPILLNLRRASKLEQGSVSIPVLIGGCLRDFDLELPWEQFEYCLRQGKFLLLMDGLDEVSSSRIEETAEAIQKFCSKYPKNPCIVASRPNDFHRVLETFTQVESLNLNVEQAAELAQRLGGQGEQVQEFCRQLRAGLFRKHQDFAENPLLLSMMYLIFMRNNSIPEHLSAFYGEAYKALYSAHDTCDKGIFHREFSSSLAEQDFTKLFARFCFQTYFKEKYEFSKSELLGYLDDSIMKFGLENVSANSFLADLRDVVCMLIEEGDTWRFSHRSFQAYFAAWYTEKILRDDQQKKFFDKILLQNGTSNFHDYFRLLFQLEPTRFNENVLEHVLREIQHQLNCTTNQNFWLLCQHATGYCIHMFMTLKTREYHYDITPWLSLNDTSNAKFINGCYLCSLIHNIHLDLSVISYLKNSPFLSDMIKCCTPVYGSKDDILVTFKNIENMDCLPQEEKSKIINMAIEDYHIPELRAKIDEILSEIDRSNDDPPEPYFMDQF